MSDDTTTPREGTPEESGPEELETTAADTETTQVLEQSAATSELPYPTPEAPEASEAPTSELPHLTPEAADAPEASDVPAAPAAAPFAPVAAMVPAATDSTPPPPATAAAPAPGGLVTVRTGPRPGAILLGLLCLLVAGYTTARQTMDWRLDLNLVGPVSIGVLGTLLLLVGLIGLVSRRRS